jgi:predicted Zn-dependent protease
MRTLLAFLAVSLFAQDDVNSYSLEKERALGRQIAAEITKDSKPVTDPAISEYANRIGRTLVSQVNDKPFDYHFEMISDDSRTEPVPLPGGYVLIPLRAFLVAADEAEFAGLLAHSIGHVALRHGRRTGGWAGAHAEANAPQVLVPVGFLETQRTYELEADQFGVALAARAGYDASALLRYVARTQSADSKMSPLPTREVRLRKLREALQSLPPAETHASSDEFRRIRESLESTTRPAPRRVPTLRRVGTGG